VSKGFKRKCAACGAKAGKSARFCVDCGKALMSEKSARPYFPLSNPGRVYREDNTMMREHLWKQANAPWLGKGA
jgi:predicted amidophosphoribosyltransferase